MRKSPETKAGVDVMTVVEAARTDGSGLTEAAIQDLKARLRAPLIVPGDSDYATARQVYNGMIDRYPRLIARCADAADVISAVNFGRESGLTVAVRGGGHNGGGLGTCDDGLVIDLSLMKGTRVDQVARTVRVEGGSTWVMWITQPTHSGWPRRAASSQPLVLAA
jgi:hypothetical protein